MALGVRTRADLPQDRAATQNNLGYALQELGTLSSAEEERKLLENAVAAYRSALAVYTPADLPQDWVGTQYNLSDALGALGNQLEGEESLKRKREAVELLRDVVSYQPDDLSRSRLASALGRLAFTWYWIASSRGLKHGAKRETSGCQELELAKVALVVDEAQDQDTCCRKSESDQPTQVLCSHIVTRNRFSNFLKRWVKGEPIII